MNPIHQRLLTLSARIARDQAEFMRLKAAAADAGDASVTVYRVRTTRVKAHNRRAFRAVRLKKQQHHELPKL